MFLYLNVPVGDVDVNVHPAKIEVRFRDGQHIETLVEEGIRRALEREESAATFGVTSAPQVRERPEAEASPAGHAQMALFASGDGPGPVEDGEPAVPPAPSTPRLWQVLNTYIFAETRDGLIIIDQHSAHERILFQRLMDAFETGGLESQRLLFPLTLRLPRAELDQVTELGSLFARSGFEVEAFGSDAVILHAVPNPHPYFDAERAFREMVGELTHGSELVRSARNQHERIAMTFACKSAIKAGQRLSAREMEDLFDQLFATELPHHDVHGRPTIIRLPASELERRFGRVS